MRTIAFFAVFSPFNIHLMPIVRQCYEDISDHAYIYVCAGGSKQIYSHELFMNFRHLEHGFVCVMHANNGIYVLSFKKVLHHSLYVPFAGIRHCETYKFSSVTFVHY